MDESPEVEQLLKRVRDVCSKGDMGVKKAFNQLEIEVTHKVADNKTLEREMQDIKKRTRTAWTRAKEHCASLKSVELNLCQLEEEREKLDASIQKLKNELRLWMLLKRDLSLDIDDELLIDEGLAANASSSTLVASLHTKRKIDLGELQNGEGDEPDVDAQRRPSPSSPASARAAHVASRSALKSRRQGCAEQNSKRIRWSTDEEHNLRLGVQVWGEGNWLNIHKHYAFHANRTPVDLKDKWRNMKR
eukprot:CAMPEP_0119301972 /NCGR_PEP_ID=MMETSP1333-20130426/3662_1 /TAXON_ID=418940 /ORGANISM="Scyphosphaera apsteinii, Strain RCC1455" /LENGTH=246 /DNA_ID=CAMNT_0007304195 /DNA_START=158 /DNA_END=898 /DNA_ORIENTATION=-